MALNKIEELALAQIIEWRRKPEKFVWDQFRVEPDKWQLAGLQAFADPKTRRIAFQACAGPGKTAELAWCGWNFLMCYGDELDHPKAAAMSVTGDNLSDNLWPEMSKWQSRSELLRSQFTWKKQRIYANDHPETWFMSARTYSKTADPEEQGRTLSGLHSKYILYLIDESGDISPNVIKSAEQGLSTGPMFGKILQAGNPTSNTGILYDSVTNNAHKWFIIRITGDPDDPMRSTRIDIDWAKEQIKTYGRDDPWVMSYILGMFPPTGVNTLLSPDEVAAAMNRKIGEAEYAHIQKRLGVDVARFGDDRTVIYPRQGLAAFNPVIMRGATGPEISARVIVAKDKWGSELEFVDGTGGYGANVIDNLRMAGFAPIDVQYAGKATDPRYFNKRSEIGFKLAEWIKNGGCLPNRPQFAREATVMTYSFKNGKLLLEPKEIIKKRLKLSPDEWDSLANTFALPDMPASINQLGVRSGYGGNYVTEYDPFRDA